MRSNKYLILLLIISVIFFISCSKDILDRIDTDPNNPTSVEVDFILPIAATRCFHDLLGGVGARFIGSYVEHFCNVHLNPYFPDRGTSQFNQAYTVLKDTKEIIDRGTDEGKWIHVGIAQIIHAMALSTLTDVFGDVPYSEALQGSEDRNPVYDSQESIYNKLFQILDDAILNLSKNDGINPGNADMLLHGNKELWTKVAWGLKARFHNRLSNINPSTSATDALNALQNSFSSSDEILAFSNYASSGSSYTNNFSYQEQIEKCFGTSLTMLDILNSFNASGYVDPRAERWFVKLDGDLIGAPNGENIPDVAHVNYSPISIVNVLYPSAPVVGLSYDELKFIEAEANFRLGDLEKANIAYKEAVAASCTRQGLNLAEINSYISQGTVYVDDESLTLDMIIKQKWLSFFISQPIEAYNDYRRTGIPVLHNTSSNLGYQTVDGIPKRMPYPAEELARNSSAPTDVNNVTIYSKKVWWAKD